MKKYQYLASWDDQTLTRVGEPVVVLGDSNVSQVEVILPSNFLLDPTGAVARMYFLLPGEKESGFETLETATKDENGDSHVTWTIKHVHSQKGGRLAFSLALIGDDAQWDSRTAIIPVYESRYQPESEEAEKPYTGRLDALEGSMAAIRGEFAEVQDDFEELKETATLGTPIPEGLVANMQEGHVYIYTGTEPGYTAGHVYYYVNGALTDGGVYGGTAVDATLTQSGQAADAKKTGDEISAIKEDLSSLDSKAVYQYAGDGKRGLFITGGATGAWGSSTKLTTLVFRIPKGTKNIKVTASAEQVAYIAFLRSYAPVSGEIPDWASGYQGRITIPAGESVTYTVVADMVYMYIVIKDTSLVYHTPTLTFMYPTDLPLAALDDTSDRSTEINLLLELFGKCILGKGTYYVSGVVMPDSTALIGTPNSIVRLLDSVTSGAAIVMSKNSLVQGVFLEGGLSEVGTTEGTRYGIEWTGEETVTGFVDDCIIRGFDGAGILLHDTTQKVYRNLLATNCRIRTNFIGIDIKKDSEFNRITNCNITANYYGIRNRGGNNHVDNCGLDANTIGIQVDADEGTNGGHGGISNCTINHSDHNNGYGIIIKDTGRMLISGCNLYYSKILLSNTDGNVINACGFGQMAGWEITDGACNVFTGCMVRSTSDSPITITNNTQTKVVNCYTRDGAEVVA